MTLCRTVLRAMPATKPVRPEPAPLERSSISMGALTAPEVMLTMRPKFGASASVQARLSCAFLPYKFLFAYLFLVSKMLPLIHACSH